MPPTNEQKQAALVDLVNRVRAMVIPTLDWIVQASVEAGFDKLASDPAKLQGVADPWVSAWQNVIEWKP